MARWYNKNSKGIGDGNDVRNCARGFSEASRSMLEARPKAARFERGDDGTAWESDAAEDLRQKMEELPELMRRFAAANGTVSARGAATAGPASVTTRCSQSLPLASRWPRAITS